jgi:hypothetical protein
MLLFPISSQATCKKANTRPTGLFSFLKLDTFRARGLPSICCLILRHFGGRAFVLIANQGFLTCRRAVPGILKNGQPWKLPRFGTVLRTFLSHSGTTLGRCPVSGFPFHALAGENAPKTPTTAIGNAFALATQETKLWSTDRI